MIVDPRCKALIDLCHELGRRANQHPEATEQQIEQVIAQFTKMEQNVEPCPCCGVASGEKHKISCADLNALVPGGDVYSPADWEGVFCAWSSLLDAIERAHDRGKKKQVARLIEGRFDLVEQYGFRVEVTGMPASGSKH